MWERIIRSVMKKRKSLFFFLLVCMFSLCFSTVCSAGWKKTNGKYRYYDTKKKSYATATWKKISKKWYYFDEKGYLKTGRFKVKGKYYYCKNKSKGRAQNKKVGSYYYGANGAMVKNCWKKCGKYMFYFGSNGKVKTGRFTLGNKTYYCSAKTGRAVKKRVGNYYYGTKGVMVKNKWVNNYYYGSNGKAKYGKFTVGGKTYYCTKKNGKVKNKWVNKNFYDEKGVMARNKWINGTYVNEEGEITKGNKNPKDPPSSSDIRLLAALVYYEAGNQPYRGKVAVASVVVNRMKSSKFPNTLRGVIYQSGQFTPAMNGMVDYLYYSGKKIQSECVKAAKEVLTKGSQLKGYYYFNSAGYGYQIGDHYFY